MHGCVFVRVTAILLQADMRPKASSATPQSRFYQLRLLIGATIVCLTFSLLLLSENRWLPSVVLRNHQNGSVLVRHNNKRLRRTLLLDDSHTLWALRERFPRLHFAWDSTLGLLTIDGKPVIWAFWDIGCPPVIFRLCLTAVICHNQDVAHVQVVNQSSLSHWLPYVHPAVPYLIPAHKADYFRARILDEYGGMYIDSDVVPLQGSRSLFDKLRWYDYVGHLWSSDGDLLSLGAIGPFKARSDFTARWVTLLHVKLDQKLPLLEKYTSDNANGPYPIGWSEILREIVKDEFMQTIMRRGSKAKYFSLNGESTVGQIMESFMKHSTSQIISVKQTPFIYWFHALAAQRTDHWKTLNQVWYQNLVLVELLAVSMQECRIRLANTKLYDASFHPKTFKIGGPVSVRRDKSLKSWVQEYMQNVSKQTC